MSTIVGIHAAKTTLSKLIERAEAGEDIVIARDGAPVARLVPVVPPARREFGLLRGLGSLGPEFFDALPEEELAAWDGGARKDAQ
jgi:prevent-host-death family protein